MKVLDGGAVIKLRVEDVIVEGRLREVREKALQNLIFMAEDTGITTPIHVRKTPAGYSLIDGAHRLEAAKRMGLVEIAAIAVDCRADEARAMEASNNLGAARMTPLQTAVFMASWRRTYFEMHPDRQKGVFKGNQYKPKEVTPQNGVTNAIAEAFGRKPSQIFKIMAVGERLTEAEIKLLDVADRVVTLEDLAALGKITDPAERASVVERLTTGKPISAAAARRQYRAEVDGVVIVPNANDAAFNALANAWDRAPVAARKRFCLQFAAALWEIQNKGAPLNNPDQGTADVGAADE
jgi:ParB family chromosome partitioning protein